MNTLRTGLLSIATVFIAFAATAQTLEDGKKMMYYERYKSAKGIFEKLLAANPNNTDAAYWLGQAYIQPDEGSNPGLAKELYQKTLMANPNSPLLIAGMGHLELLEKKPQDARNRFETAISLTQAKNAAVLNAVGLANWHAPAGDANYAIEKLTLAAGIKKMNDPDVYINMGEAYRDLQDGGKAQSAYENALTLNPNYARASYRIGKIYQTQGVRQEEIYMRYYEEAMAKDPAFAPVYENLYQYYYFTNVTKAAEYFEKYVANTDDDEKLCLNKATLKYAQGLFAESISKADECIAAQGANPLPNLYGLKAYAFDRLKDSVNAKSAFENYFNKQVPEKIGPTDYKTYAEILLKFPGNEEQAGVYMDKAVAADSTEAGKVNLLRSMAVAFESQKKFAAAGDWYSKMADVRKETRKTDLFYAGSNYTKGGEIQKSIAVFDKYIQKFPGESMGYFMNAKNFVRLDSADTEGKALNYYTKIVDMAEQIKDKPGEKDRIKASCRYLVEYYANVKKDKENSLLYCDRAIALDTTDAEFKNIRDIISKATLGGNKAPAAKPAVKDNKTPAQKASENKPAGTKPSAPKAPAAKKK
jgi:Flp pilus assembly protein TadD